MMSYVTLFHFSNGYFYLLPTTLFQSFGVAPQPKNSVRSLNLMDETPPGIMFDEVKNMLFFISLTISCVTKTLKTYYMFFVTNE